MKCRRTTLTCVFIAAAGCAWVGLDSGALAQVQSGVVMGRAARSGPRPDGAGSIRGRVIDSAMGQPLRDAVISASWRGPSGEDAQFAARTDGEGVFAIEQLPDGVYFVHVRRQGFFDAPGATATRQLTVRSGGTIDMGDVRLMRGGILTGRVLDEHGEPVPRAMVTPVGRLPGQDVLMARGGMTMTDDRGVYRAHGLAPGPYTVRVVPQGPSGRGPVRLQGEERELLPAFASSASEPAAADLVDVRPGAEAVLDVRLPAGRLTAVAGQVVLADDVTTPTRGDVSLRPVERNVQMHLARTTVRPDGRFEFLDVAPGRYLLAAEEQSVFTPEGPSRHRAGWVEIAVTGEPLTEIAVPIGYGAVVRGRIEGEGGDYAALANRTLHVMSSTSASSHPSTMSSRSGHASATTDLGFELRDMLGHRQLHVMGLPPGWWLKSVLIDGEDAFEGHEFPVSGTVDGVVLLVSARQSGVTGRVQGGGGDLQGSAVMVMPEGQADARRTPSANRRIASVSMDGTFTADGLRPGRYSIVALSPRARSVYDNLGREERQALIAANGRVVDIVEGGLETVTLRLVER